MKTLAQWTVDDYHRMIEAGLFADRRVELLQGEIVEMPPENPTHNYTNHQALGYLQSLLGDRADVLSPGPIDLNAWGSEPEPDIAIVRPPLSCYKHRHPNPEDIHWLIEISNSTLAYDLNDKQRLYALAGISEYWAIDVQASQAWVHRQPEGEQYRVKTAIAAGSISPLAFPAIAVDLVQLLG
ncbi:Uma2 family endonuclease [Synechococcus sp. PCC 7336]|uniref:Uma2 family endonuclease n=1 Tax=Synechococcus sp. PCC 7336 TaxID=195250 RepID=UPI000345CC33|nr:Uma2 family endonuclease [Synechococcus sp. PCC 7336]